MYAVKYINGSQWHIVDSNQQTVFVGNKQQAEEWLDLQENAQRQAAASPVSRSRIRVALQSLCGHMMSGVSSLAKYRASTSVRSGPKP